MLRHSRAAPGARWVASAAAETSEAAAEPSAGQQAPQPLDLQPLPADQLARNAALVERLRGQLILAPLTRGGCCGRAAAVRSGTQCTPASGPCLARASAVTGSRCVMRAVTQHKPACPL